jgi:hypothetical protein
MDENKEIESQEPLLLEFTDEELKAARQRIDAEGGIDFVRWSWQLENERDEEGDEGDDDSLA